MDEIRGEHTRAYPDRQRSIWTLEPNSSSLVAGNACQRYRYSSETSTQSQSRLSLECRRCSRRENLLIRAQYKNTTTANRLQGRLVFLPRAPVASLLVSFPLFPCRHRSAVLVSSVRPSGLVSAGRAPLPPPPARTLTFTCLSR